MSTTPAIHEQIYLQKTLKQKREERREGEKGRTGWEHACVERQ